MIEMKKITETHARTSVLFGIVRNFVLDKEKTKFNPKNPLLQNQNWDSFESSKAGRTFYAETEIKRSQAIIELNRHNLR